MQNKRICFFLPPENSIQTMIKEVKRNHAIIKKRAEDELLVEPI